jgi:septum formation protein
MLNSKNKPKITLASESPRRNILLRQAGLSFSVIPSSFDESTVSMITPQPYVKILAQSKALDVSKSHPDNWIIGADTIVVINETILGKPTSKNNARDMLNCLSNTTHTVITGYCICCQTEGKLYSDTVSTDVIFKPLSEKEIEWYIHTEEPFDKAGAYAIQGLASSFVKEIIGSYTNVVGLPVYEIVDYLLNEHIIDIKDLSSEAYHY